MAQTRTAATPGRAAAPAVHRVATALGTFGLAWSANGLRRVLLPEASPHAAPTPLPADLADCAGRLAAYASGEPVAFDDIPLDETGLPAFERQVFAALRRVGWGRTTTYGALAAAAGAPDAARAVGAAMARNRWPVIVPCHRVLAAGRALGGFSGPGGPATKARLLRLEGVPVAETPPLPGLFD